MTQPEMVDHPAHYGGKDDPYEAVKVIEAWGLPWHLGDCVKYIARHGKKDPAKTIEDLKKARWYLDRYIGFLESQSDVRALVERCEFLTPLGRCALPNMHDAPHRVSP